MKSATLLLLTILVVIQSTQCALSSEERKDKKILVYGTPSFVGPTASELIAIDLAQKGYTVALVINEEDTTKAEYLTTFGIEPIMLPGVNQMWLIEQYEQLVEAKFSISSQENLEMAYVDQIFNNNVYFVEFLNQHNFDMIITEQQAVQQVIINYLRPPFFVEFVDNVLDPLFLESYGYPALHSSETNVLRHRFFGMKRLDSQLDMAKSFFTRLQNFITVTLVEGFSINKKSASKYMPDDYKQYADMTRYPNLTLVHSVEGINPAIPTPPGVKFVYPKYRQLPQSGMTLDKKVQAFMDKHAKIMFVSFGPYIPLSGEVLQSLQTFASSPVGYAIIINVPNEAAIDQSQLRKLQNMNKVLIIKDIPEQLILKNPKTKIFVNNGDKNGMIAGIESAVPLLIVPQANQYEEYLCQYVHMIKVGICLLETELSQFQQSIATIEKNNFYKEKLSRLQQAIIRKSQERKDFIYWIDYAFEVGTIHFQMTQYYQMSFLTKHDLDLHFLILSAILLAIAAAVLAIWIIYKVGKIIFRFVKAKIEQRKAAAEDTKPSRKAEKKEKAADTKGKGKKVKKE